MKLVFLLQFFFLGVFSKNLIRGVSSFYGKGIDDRKLYEEHLSLPFSFLPLFDCAVLSNPELKHVTLLKRGSRFMDNIV